MGRPLGTPWVAGLLADMLVTKHALDPSTVAAHCTRSAAVRGIRQPTDPGDAKSSASGLVLHPDSERLDERPGIRHASPHRLRDQISIDTVDPTKRAKAWMGLCAPGAPTTALGPGPHHTPQSRPVLLLGSAPVRQDRGNHREAACNCDARTAVPLAGGPHSLGSRDAMESSISSPRPRYECGPPPRTCAPST